MLLYPTFSTLQTPREKDREGAAAHPIPPSPVNLPRLMNHYPLPSLPRLISPMYRCPSVPHLLLLVCRVAGCVCSFDTQFVETVRDNVVDGANARAAAAQPAKKHAFFIAARMTVTPRLRSDGNTTRPHDVR